MFFFNDTATTEIYTLSLHDRSSDLLLKALHNSVVVLAQVLQLLVQVWVLVRLVVRPWTLDRKSTRLNSSHANISYAVFCLKKTLQPLLSAAVYDIHTL